MKTNTPVSKMFFQQLMQAKVILLLTLLFLVTSSIAQTQLIGPLNGGDFESSTNIDDFLSNGWTVSNPGTGNHSMWHLNNNVGFGASSTNRSAYISSNNTNLIWVYNPTGGNATAASYCHLYRSVTVPAGETIINLSFDWQCNGELAQDGLQVAWSNSAPTASSSTYDATTTAQTGPVAANATLLTPGVSGFLNLKTSAQGFYTELPSLLATGTPFYLIFTWRNNNGFSNTKPAAIDNVLLTSTKPVPSAGSHQYDKTLFVEFFGTSIFNVDEDNNGTYEREDALLLYAQSHSYQNLILKKLDDPITNYPQNSTVQLFSRTAVTPTAMLSADQIALEAKLAVFLNRAHTAYGIRYIGAGSPPTQGSASTQQNTDNLFFDNINEFNFRQLDPNGINHTAGYCFDIIFTEADYWGGDPSGSVYTSYENYFKYGLDHMHDDVKATSNTSGYHPLLVSTYVGDFMPLATATPTAVNQQSQANMLEENVDWLFLSFYFDGKLIDHSPQSVVPYPIEFFDRDKNLWGDRLSVLNSTPTHNMKILPLFGSQSSGNPGRNYFGDYLKNKNGHVYDDFINGDYNWQGYPDNLDLLFHVYLNTENPLNFTSLSIKQQYPNLNFSEGFGWFKYGTMPDADHLMTVPADIALSNNSTENILSSEFVTNSASGATTGGHTSSCSACRNDINTHSGYAASKSYTWYVYDFITGIQTKITNATTPLCTADVHNSMTDYYSCEIDFNDPTHQGTFSNLKIRDEMSITGSTIVSSGGSGGALSEWKISDRTYANCPSFNNASAKAECTNLIGTVSHYVWQKAGQADVQSVASIASGLTPGFYTVSPICIAGSGQLFQCYGYNSQGGTFQPTTNVWIYSLDGEPHPLIENQVSSDMSCNENLTTEDFGSATYQWKNALGQVLASTQTYTATQNGTYTVTVTNANGCAGTSAAYNLQMYPTPTVSGSDITCENNQTYSVTEDPNNATYHWTLPNGVSASADGYSTITISNWNSAATTGGTISCTVTNACGNSATANFVVKGCCDIGVGDLNNATLSSTQTLSGTFNINGTLNISGSGTVVTMSSADVQLNKEAKITIGAGAKLIITGSSYLRTCGTDMWTGIVLQSSSSEVQLIGKSKIEDALVAINSIQNGKVVIDDATLNANYIGLKITGTSVANSSYIGSRAVFSCKNSSNVNANCLKSPHSSQRTLQGICLNGIGSLSIGDASNSANEISNCETGIYTSTSTVNVTKTDFEACNIGINAQNDADLSVTSCNFDECVTGIDDRYNVDLNVSSCNFNTGTKGIYTSLGNKISIGIHDNNFTDFKAFAIQHISNHQVQYSIYSNIISNTGSEGMNYPGGIEINGLYDNSIDNSSVTDIYHNEFYNLAKGIHLQSIDYAHIFNNLHNELVETGSYDYQTYGIKIENCSSTRIEVNSVSSYGSSQQQIWWSNGIMADNSPYTNLFCNSVGNIGRGLWIGGASPHTTLAGNAMGDCYDQVYLNWNLMGLQDQGASTTTNPPNGLALDNEWIGSAYTAGNGHQTTSYFSNYFKGGGYTTFHTRSGSTYEPTDNYTHDPNNDYQACTTNILTNFSADPYCTERPELPNNSEYESRVAQDSIDYDSYFETFKWMGKEYLLSRSKQDANLAANDADIANAVAQLEQENVGTIGALKDSLINVEVDSATSAVISPLQQINNGLQPALAVESNYKTATNISMSFAQNKTFTNSQKSTIIYLSNLCPYSAGPAVYMARTLRALFEEIPPRYNSCDNYNPIPQNRKANLNQYNEFVSSYKLFPSPSDGNAVYEFSIDKKASAKLKVYDYTGKLILQQDVSGTNKYEFKKLNLSEGVYHVQLFVNGDLASEQNMVVVK